MGKMCGVCGRILHRRDDGEFIHPENLLGPEDHIVIPLDLDVSRAVVSCDFCPEPTSPDNRFTLPAEDFRTPWIIGTDQIYRGAWCACGTCAHFIETDDWKGLIIRCVSTRAQGNVALGLALVDEFVNLYAELNKHILGPIRPWRPGDENGGTGL